jgi:hypothetical protein
MRILNISLLWLLSACSIPVQLKQVSILPSLESGDQRDQHIVRVDINKDNWRDVINSQLYVYIHVIDCENREVMFAVHPTFNGVSSGDFHGMAVEMERLQGDTVTIQGSFDGELDLPPDRYCVTLDGGGYFGRTIQSNIVRARIVRKSR